MNLAEIQVSYTPTPSRVKITNNKALEKYIRPAFKEIEWVESVFLVCMASNGKALGYRNISEGSNSNCHISISKVLQIALKCNACNIAIVHNHPSGNTKPSKADLSIKESLAAACRLVEINLVDFAIITKRKFVSI